MKQEYEAWIAEHVPDHDAAYGRCKEVSELMARDFPELKVVRGHYHCAWWKERTHWWCETTSGEIIDPTAIQFPSKGHGSYEPWNDGDKEPTGVCMNCGNYVYDNETFCCKQCEIETVEYMAGNHG